MLVDALLQHEVEGQVNRMVEKVKGLEIKQEVVGVAKEVTEVAEEVVEVAKEVAEVAKEVVEMAKKVIRVVKEVVKGNVRTVNMNNGRGGCSYKEFMACNLKDCNGKGGAIVYTRWIKKMESVQDMSREEFCPYNEMQKLETKFWCHVMAGAGHAAYTDQFHELARLVPHLVTPENKRIERYIYGLVPQIHGMVVATKPKIIHNAILKAGMLTDEAIRNGALKKNTEKRGNNGEPGRDGNVRNDNKRYRTGRASTIIINPVMKEYTSTVPKCPTATITIHPRLNQAPRPGGNRPNKVMAIEGGQGRGNNGNPAHGRAFVMGAEEARQDPDIVTGTFTLNNYYATTLFDYDSDYSFISTTFVPLLDIDPNNLGFSYKIKIASGQLIEINKVIRGCKLEIEGHTFDINLIPFGHGSFDVIVGMDWLSRHKAKIVFQEKVVRIPLPNGEMLRVLRERP
ncbi:reverse transcriptase domain-containing protein [Tanacetum coccineum]